MESNFVPPEAPPSGPYVAAALICEQVIEGKDGVLTPVRIVDRFVVNVRGPVAEVPTALPLFPLSLVILVSLKSGAARGRHTLTLRPEKPSGQKMEPLNFPILFEGEDRGVNQIFRMEFGADEEGLYWFDVLVDGKLMTRIPMRVVYQPMSVGTSTGG